MRRFMLVVWVGLICGSRAAFGQAMPGQPVGKPLVQPVGMQLPQVGTQLPKVGSPPPGYAGLTGSNVYTPPKSTVDPKLVVAPYPTTMPGTEPKSFWDKLYDRWFSMFGSGTPTAQQRNWTPGLGRRNKERADARWQRD